MKKFKQRGFTLIELMTATVLGMITITAVYAVGAASNRQFQEQNSIALTQGSVRMAIEKVRRDIFRAGLFGTPKAKKERTCEQSDAATPKLEDPGGTLVDLGAIQYAQGDGSIVDPNNLNSVRADRLRVLGNMITSDRYLVAGTTTDGDVIYLQPEWQAFRRSFLARPVVDAAVPELNALATFAWEDQLVMIETNNGQRLFRRSTTPLVQTEATEEYQGSKVVYSLTLDRALPVGTECLPGQAEGSTISPLAWIDYEVISAFDGEVDYGAVSDSTDGEPVSATSEFESDNAILVRRMLNPDTGATLNDEIEIIAEYVADFRVSFVIDRNSGTQTAPDLALLSGDDADGEISANPERVRSVIVDLGVRTSRHDPRLTFDVNQGGVPGTFKVTNDLPGAARIRRARIEVPVPNIGMRNL